MCKNQNPPPHHDAIHSEATEYLSDRFLDALQTGVIFFDGDGRVIRANQTALKDLQMTKSIEGNRLSGLLSVEYRNTDILPELLSRFDNIATEKVPLPPDVLIVTKTGKAIFFAVGNITRLEQNRFLFTFRNVVEERTRNYMIKMALNPTKIFPWFYDFNRNAMIIDPRYYEYTGIPSTDNTMTLEAFAERLHPDDRAAMANAFTLQLNGEHYPYPVPFRLRRGDNRYEWFEGQSTYLGQVKGMPYRIVGVCMSTQAHKDIEEALIAAKNKAEQSDRLKSAFLANMSHELRTPLNAIVGFSNLFSGGEIDLNSEEAREYAALISKNCDHLLKLVSDILDLSRIETGAMEYNLEKHSLHRLLRNIYQNYNRDIPEGVSFNLTLPPQDTEIITDPLRMRQIIEHLIDNAVKFTSRGFIELGYTLSEDKENIRLFVADSGEGIPADQTEKIFDRFYKVDTFVQGAGLGLSICKIITERLGGTISVTSQLKKGSRFIIKLPLKPQENTTYFSSQSHE